MEFFYQPCSTESSSFRSCAERTKHNLVFAVSAVLQSFIYATLTIFFTVVGSIIGAVTGATIGQKSESGFLHGAAVGVMTGILFSIEVFEHSCLLLQTDKTGIMSLCYLIDVVEGLLNHRLIPDQVIPTMLREVQGLVGIKFKPYHYLRNQILTALKMFYQMPIAEASFEEASDLFDTGGDKGLSEDMVEKIPVIEITSKSYIDTSGERISCRVCLQNLQTGETARRLPNCNHVFHRPCIDKWFIRHGSCPLCRRGL